MQTRVIILAAGDAVRFNHVKKQMLPINRGDTIIGRIIKQCSLMGYSPIIAVKDMDSMLGYQVRYSQRIYIVNNSNTTCNTILSTKELWRERTIILLGDVIYSPETISKIFDYHGDFRVYGNSQELFAVVFHECVKDNVIKALEKASRFKNGKVRFMYKSYVGMPMDSKETMGVAPGPNFQYIHDWTRDVDTEKEYHNTMLELVNTHKLDNKYV